VDRPLGRPCTPYEGVARPGIGFGISEAAVRSSSSRRVTAAGMGELFRRVRSTCAWRAAAQFSTSGSRAEPSPRKRAPGVEGTGVRFGRSQAER